MQLWVWELVKQPRLGMQNSRLPVTPELSPPGKMEPHFYKSGLLLVEVQTVSGMVWWDRDKCKLLSDTSHSD